MLVSCECLSSPSAVSRDFVPGWRFFGRFYIQLVRKYFMFNPERLKVLDRAIDLVGDVVKLTDRFPAREGYELGRQMRRAAESIGSNISEGNSRGVKEYIYFLKVAVGSANELEAQLKMVRRLGYVDNEGVGKLRDEVVEIRRMIFGVIRFLGRKRD